MHVLTYNVSRFIAPVLANLAPHVDRIYQAHSERPSGYIPESRNQYSNPITLGELALANKSSKIKIITGDWLDEDSMRNACLDAARNEGMDWLITQDADEFYSGRGWAHILQELKKDKRSDEIVTTWYNFWKSSEYVLVHPSGDVNHTNTGFALRCRDTHKFINRRNANAKTRRILDVPCYHYGYVMSDLEMSEKLSTCSHSLDFNSKKWYASKWLSWSEHTRHLHPVALWVWNRAIRFPLEQPPFAHDFAISLSPKSPRNFKDRIYGIGDNALIELRQFLVRSRDVLLR